MLTHNESKINYYLAIIVFDLNEVAIMILKLDYLII